MRGSFDEPEFEQQRAPRRDTEVTLGAISLSLLLLVLLGLCGLCFGLGYSMGHHEPAAAEVTPPAPAHAQTEQPADNAHAKPSADASEAVVQAATTPQSETQDDPEAAGKPVSESTAARVAAPASAGTTPPVVRPAFGAPETSVQTAQAPATGSLMVQIASVAQTEDADVLMSALRRRGYAVVARREPLDGLIHVRIGPFKTRAEADSWRQKLLNDGYNAIVQP
jgi:cell division septation protein DedD